MRKRIMITLSVTIALFGLAYWYFFVDMNHLPSGRLIASYLSPNMQYTINVYISEGNATVADSIRAELVTANSKRNIYWQYKEFSSEVTWLTEDIVCINGIQLDVRTDTYDWRRMK